MLDRPHREPLRLPRLPSPGAGVWSFIAHAITRWQRDRARAALENLSDGMLEDIGLARRELPRVADEVAGLAAPRPAIMRREEPSVERAEIT